MPLYEKLKRMSEFLDSDSSGNELALVSHLTGILAELVDNETVVTKEMIDLFDTDQKRKILLTSFISLLLQGISVNFGE